MPLGASILFLLWNAAHITRALLQKGKADDAAHKHVVECAKAIWTNNKTEVQKDFGQVHMLVKDELPNACEFLKITFEAAFPNLNMDDYVIHAIDTRTKGSPWLLKTSNQASPMHNDIPLGLNAQKAKNFMTLAYIVEGSNITCKVYNKTRENEASVNYQELVPAKETTLEAGRWVSFPGKLLHQFFGNGMRRVIVFLYKKKPNRR